MPEWKQALIICPLSQDQIEQLDRLDACCYASAGCSARWEQLSSEVLRVVAIPVTMGIPGREI